MTAPALEVRSITRVFGREPGSVTALSDVSFRADDGEVVALLGANGAGKTTLVKVLSTLLLPTAGSAEVLGLDVVRRAKEVRPQIGVVFGGDRGLYTRISGRENLRFFGMLAGVSRSDLRDRLPVMLEQVGLSDAADRRVETYSRGMRQRLHIAIGMIARPRVLLLDEPTIGLDPIEAERLRASVQGLRSKGVTILLTSHYLLDVERLADRVVMLDSGRIAADQTLTEFTARAGYTAVVVVRIRGDADSLADRLPEGVRLDSKATTDDVTEVALRLQTWGGGVLTRVGTILEGLDVLDIQVRPAGLEEAFTSSLAEPEVSAR